MEESDSIYSYCFNAPKFINSFILLLMWFKSGLVKYGNLNTSLIPIDFIYNIIWSIAT